MWVGRGLKFEKTMGVGWVRVGVKKSGEVWAAMRSLSHSHSESTVSLSGLCTLLLLWPFSSQKPNAHMPGQ